MPEIRESALRTASPPVSTRASSPYRDRTLPLVAEPRVLDESVGMVDAGPLAFPTCRT